MVARRRLARLGARLFLASAVLGALGGRRFRRVRTFAHRGTLGDEELRRLLHSPVSDVLNAAAALAALAELALMVWKP